MNRVAEPELHLNTSHNLTNRDKFEFQMTGISKQFGGVRALDGVDFAVSAGSVHCLAGENGCGKSTLIKIASGVLKPDGGIISVTGRTYAHGFSPRESIKSGVEVIYQDLSLLPNLTVAENIALAVHAGTGRWFFSQREARRIATRALDQLHVSLELNTLVGDLTIAAKQLTAIARALARDARLIFMDEPTTALTWREVEALFVIVRQLTAKGVAVVFVSHKLNEVLDISDQITVLRNGHLVAKGPAREFDRAALSRAMTGHEEAVINPPIMSNEQKPVLLDVQGLTAPGRFANVSFAVRQNEIVGFAGLLGSGASELVEALFGIAPADEGTISVTGQQRHIRRPTDAINAGIGYVPGDRLSQGLFLNLPIDTNIAAASVDLIGNRLGLLIPGEIKANAQKMVSELQIKASSVSAPVSSLSGGNQQRVVLAKWLQRKPSVLLLNGPSVGVDIGSKEEMHRLLRQLNQEGTAILVLSDDISELVALCNRVLVMSKGRLIAELAGSEVNEKTILQEMLA
ncbi:lipase [Ktedonobacteria bacterium brp13]|nr:lipase [Ktedonobacteria bacterium brp13]